MLVHLFFLIFGFVKHLKLFEENGVVNLKDRLEIDCKIVLVGANLFIEIEHSAVDGLHIGDHLVMGFVTKEPLLDTRTQKLL